MQTLKNILLVNALSSGLTGLLLTIIPDALAGIFGVQQSWPFLATGAFLVLFSLFVFFVAYKKKAEPTWIIIIISLDSLWVSSSLLVVVFQLFGLTLWGYVLISGVGAWVALMAYLQQLGLKKMQTDTAE